MGCVDGEGASAALKYLHAHTHAPHQTALDEWWVIK